MLRSIGSLTLLFGIVSIGGFNKATKQYAGHETRYGRIKQIQFATSKVADKLVSLDAHLSTPLNVDVAGECCITLSSVTAQFEIVAAEGIAYALLRQGSVPLKLTFNSHKYFLRTRL